MRAPGFDEPTSPEGRGGTGNESTRPADRAGSKGSARAGTKGSARPPGTSPWKRTALVALVAVVVLAALVVLTRWLLTLDGVAGFVERYPGVATQPESAPVGLPGWVGWQHFRNMFFLVLLIRTGWLIRSTPRPNAYWKRDSSKFPRTKRAPKKISLNLWLHLSVDALWILNGVVFVVLLFATGQWMRVVPTGWDVFPHALSVGLQYLSLDWPAENGWLHYNALQELTYFVTIFVAAPIAALTGLRMSPAWNDRWRVSKALPLPHARRLHGLSMLYFIIFVITHVTLVLTTGALRNLNHIYTASDDAGWLGFGLFAGSVVLVVGACALARPMFLQPIASLNGKVTAR